MPYGGNVWYGEWEAVVLVLTVGDAGVGGGGLGVEIGMVLVLGAESEFVVAAASSSHESATVMEFVMTVGAWNSGDDMASLSRDDCSADADVEVIIDKVMLLRGILVVVIIVVIIMQDVW
jgi:hypothetical protein